MIGSRIPRVELKRAPAKLMKWMRSGPRKQMM